MKRSVVPALVAAIIAASPIAFAAETATGKVKTFDKAAMTLTLADGTVYQLPSAFKDPGLKAGESVQIAWEMKDGKHMASTVTIER